MPHVPSLQVSCTLCLRLHAPADPVRSNPLCPRCAPRPAVARREVPRAAPARG